MTSKLKCPVCQQDLGIILCDTDDFICSKCRMCGDEKLWKALTQAKQDLETAQEALKKLICECNRCRRDEFEGVDIDWGRWAMAAKNTVETALKQIEHKEK